MKMVEDAAFVMFTLNSDLTTVNTCTCIHKKFLMKGETN